MAKESGKVRIESLEDLINLNLRTLENVVNDQIDNRKAGLIFTGSRTVAASFKLGVEAVKLGMSQVAGLNVGRSTKRLKEKSV